MATKVSAIIPARNELFLPQTINDLLIKAAGDIEVIAVLDGYEPNPPLAEDKRLRVIRFDAPRGMRAGVNAAARVATGDFLMKCDAHCMFAEGFDEVLKTDCGENWVVIPRRYSLDPENWQIADDGKPPVDYQHFIYPRKFKPLSLHGYRWDERGVARKNLLLDDTLTFQGSCWFMRRKHFEQNGFLRLTEYRGLPQQEAEEIGLTTWFGGGRVAVNKKTWYAHLFKGRARGRGYPINPDDKAACYQYSYQHWVNDNWQNFVALIDRFAPLPEWPSDWKWKLQP